MNLFLCSGNNCQVIKLLCNLFFGKAYKISHYSAFGNQTHKEVSCYHSVRELSPDSFKNA